MKKTLLHIRKFLAGSLLPALVTLVGFTSCDSSIFHEDLQPCPQGLSVRFIYDYHLETGNAFPEQGDCLTLLVYDTAGRWVCTKTAGKEQIADENWRMTLDLPAGSYYLLAYGGMECSDASFSFAQTPSTTPMRDLEVFLHPSLLTEPDGSYLHPLFYGNHKDLLKVTVPSDALDYTECTVEMMRDTNDFRIILANENGAPISADDYTFTITDNNTRFNYLNQIISTEDVVYRQWARGDVNVGQNPDDTPFSMAWGDISTSRLMENSSARLTVYRKDGLRVLSIPLIPVLEMYKLEAPRFKKMGTQEFLDRKNTWVMTFFLNGEGVWAQVSIIIDDWEVRIDNITDF